jgi:hypothetical protein
MDISIAVILVGVVLGILIAVYRFRTLGRGSQDAE